MPHPQQWPITTNNPKLQALFGELSDKELDRQSSACDIVGEWSDSARLWLQNFHKYLNTCKHVGDLSIVCWWGINAPQYPVWDSLACNYLFIMATSVSFKCTFSAAGITISKQQNHLKANIVEALQFMKCCSKKELLFHEDPSVAADIQALK